MPATPALAAVARLALMHAEADDRWRTVCESDPQNAYQQPLLDAEDAMTDLKAALEEYVRCKPREFAEVLARGVKA